MPETDSSLPIVCLNNCRPLNHPWIYWKEVEKLENPIPPGSVVDILNSKKQWVGRGFYNGHARLRLRVLTVRRSEQIDERWICRCIKDAIELRESVLNCPKVSDAYRLVHAEGDGLSGLVIDKLGGVLVIEFFAAGMFRLRAAIGNLLSELYPNCTQYFFAQKHVQKQESFDLYPRDPPDAVVIRENGVQFQVVPSLKHKTGFFIDQRENRKDLSEIVRSKSVLDLCCFTGGFGLYAKKLGHAEKVVGIDQDEGVLAIAQNNAQLNSVEIEFHRERIVKWLSGVIENKSLWDVVVLDPSKQTRSEQQLSLALSHYEQMNTLALRVVKLGGIFVSSSCSGLVKEDVFLSLLSRAAFHARRNLQIFRVTGAGPDHPYLSHVPESRYLKVAWCRVV